MGGRMLVLDDDLAVVKTLCMMAETLGFETRGVDSAHDFFAAVASWSPSHIVVDLIMPLTDGVEVVLELRRRDCKAHLVILSGAGPRVLDAAKRAASEAGLNVLGTLPKPFTSGKLRRLLGHAYEDSAARSPDAEAALANGDKEIAEADLRQAIQGREIGVVFQPKVQCADLRLSGFEALARWVHPTAGSIPPSVFIPIAEKTGLIDDLTEIVFEDAIQWLGSAFARTTQTIAVNISTQTFSDIRLADILARAAGRHGVDPKRIILEVTETGAMADPFTTISLATRLRLKGFQLSIDDFGIGYSSLAQLARLPFSELKIDKSFVQGMETNKESRKIVKAVVALGHSLNLRVTAEGVEDASALNSLTEMRCDLAQGYFIGRPMNREAVSTWLSARAQSASARAI